jgi:peptide/nickel transport system ATP-binding protein
MSAVPIRNPRLRHRQRRIHLEGEIADPAHPPSGCYFHPRCQYAQRICATEEPPLRLLKSTSIEPSDHFDHYAACHFADELELHGVIASGKDEKI